MNRVPQPGPFCPHPKQLHRDKADPSHITPHSVDPPVGHWASITLLPLSYAQRPHPWAQEGQRPSLHLVQIWSCTKQGASDHLLLGQWDPLTNPQLLGHNAATSPWGESKEPA